MDDGGLAFVAEELVKLQATVAAQGELISRLIAGLANFADDPPDRLSSERSEEEAVAYASAILQEDDASDRLLLLMARKAEAKRIIFELAERMLATPG